jgi:hypothetical protein
MVWSTLAMMISGIALIALHLWRHSPHTWVAVVALALAVFTFLGGFSIGVFVAPATIFALVAAALAVPATRGAAGRSRR